MDGYRVCSMEHIIERTRASNRLNDRESLPRLRDYAVYLEHDSLRRCRRCRRDGAAACRRRRQTPRCLRQDRAVAAPPNRTNGSTSPAVAEAEVRTVVFKSMKTEPPANRHDAAHAVRSRARRMG